MGSACCCLRVEDFEEYLHPNSSLYRHCICLRCFIQQFNQLFQLMQWLEKTAPHFIRCIKPNNSLLPGVYKQGMVLQQLRCCGVLEVVRISRSGYPTRMSHQKFARRMMLLLHMNLTINLGKKGWAYGFENKLLPDFIIREIWISAMADQIAVTVRKMLNISTPSYVAQMVFMQRER